ncbi:hypothetical protein HNV12_04095 [Methanococcoides sp. SA1]|nr:hypothetical protein [Methanococcoides sp. SA1]
MSNRQILDQIDSCLRVYGTIVPGNNKVNYLTHFVTKGDRYYCALERAGAKNLKELNQIDSSIIIDVRRENLAEGQKMKKDLEGANVGYVILPGEFFAKGWTQQHYAEFWKSVVERYADRVVFHDKFYTSEGGLEEFITAIEEDKERRLFAGFRRFKDKDILSEVDKTIVRVEKIGEDISRFEDINQRLLKLL